MPLLRYFLLISVGLGACVKPPVRPTDADGKEKAATSAPATAPTTEGPLGRKPMKKGEEANPESPMAAPENPPVETGENPPMPAPGPMPEPNPAMPAPPTPNPQSPNPVVEPVMIPKNVNVGQIVKTEKEILAGGYTIIVKNRCLTADGKASGAPLKLAICDASPAQIFQVEKADGFVYSKLTSTASALSLQVRGASKIDGTPVEQAGFAKNQDHQLVKFEEKKDGTFVLRFKHSGKVLAASADEKTAIQADENGKPVQVWTLGQKSVVPVKNDDAGRRYVFVNQCKFPVWVGSQANPGFPQVLDGDFKLDPTGTNSVRTIEKWEGRFWGRYNCSYDANGKFSCGSGDCFKGGEKCEGSHGETPVTLAEIRTHSDFEEMDFFNISWVDGSNLPMDFRPIEGSFKPNPSNPNWCKVLTCKDDMRARCPKELEKKDKMGNIVGCLSACEVFKTDAYCCLGAFSEQKCKPTSYSKIFKEVCPVAYSYAMDLGAFPCRDADYQITFCPGQ